VTQCLRQGLEHVANSLVLKHGACSWSTQISVWPSLFTVALFRHTATEQTSLAVMLQACILLVFEGFSPRTQTILAEALESSTRILYRIGYDSFKQYFFSFIVCHHIIQLCIMPKLTALSNNIEWLAEGISQQVDAAVTSCTCTQEISVYADWDISDVPVLSVERNYSLPKAKFSLLYSKENKQITRMTFATQNSQVEI
jgi:hypothetical protein